MARERGLVHRLVRRIPGSQETYRRLKIRRALAQKVVRVDHPTLDVRIRVTNEATARLRVESVAKEPWTVAWLERSVRPGDVVWDVGANVGVYALLAARLLGEEGEVVAVEPGYASFAALCDNVLLNGLEKRVMPLPLVLGESCRTATLDYSDLRAGSALHLLDSADAAGGVPPARPRAHARRGRRDVRGGATDTPQARRRRRRGRRPRRRAQPSSPGRSFARCSSRSSPS